MFEEKGKHRKQLPYAGPILLVWSILGGTTAIVLYVALGGPIYTESLLLTLLTAFALGIFVMLFLSPVFILLRRQWDRENQHFLFNKIDRLVSKGNYKKASRLFRFLKPSEENQRNINEISQLLREKGYQNVFNVPLGMSVIGKEGVVIETCDPNGRVKVGAEIWNAESINGESIPKSDEITVRNIKNLTLLVERNPP